MAYKTQIFLPFHLADPAGIIFFGHVFTLAHQAYEEWISKDLGIQWDDWFKNPNWIVPIKHAEADYMRPLIAGKICEVNLQLAEIRTSSFRLDYAFNLNGEVCCIVKHVHVFCERSSMKKIDIPLSIKPKLI